MPILGKWVLLMPVSYSLNVSPALAFSSPNSFRFSSSLVFQVYNCFILNVMFVENSVPTYNFDDSSKTFNNLCFTNVNLVKDKEEPLVETVTHLPTLKEVEQEVAARTREEDDTSEQEDDITLIGKVEPL